MNTVVKDHFRRVVFTISKEHDIYIDEVLLDDKRKDKKEFPNGRSEYIRKLINDDMHLSEIPRSIGQELPPKNNSR